MEIPIPYLGHLRTRTQGIVRGRRRSEVRKKVEVRSPNGLSLRSIHIGASPRGASFCPNRAQKGCDFKPRSQTPKEPGRAVLISTPLQRFSGVLSALRGREPFQRFARLPIGPPLIIIPQGNLVGGKFAWGRGDGAFSVSHSGVEEMAKYIAGRRSTIANEDLLRNFACWSSATD